MMKMATCLVARFAATLGLAAAMLAPLCPLHAQQLDPFQNDGGTWKSFARYKEEQKERLLSTMTGNLERDAVARDALERADDPAPDSAPDRATDEKTALATLPSASPASGAPMAPEQIGEPPATTNSRGSPTTPRAFATPDRPLALPVMPAINKGFDIRVGSTVVQDEGSPTAHITNMEAAPDLMLPKQNWLDAAQAALRQAQGKDYLGDTMPLNIRLSFLPGFDAVASAKSAHGVAVATAKPLATPAPEKSASDIAACAAVEAYKKRQLEAIQSDRQTLAALQDAIAKLGLQKQLNFMSGAEGPTNTSANNGPLINLPSPAIPALPPVAKP
ncbi:MAG: hypothetical protein M3N08_04690 [Pseudomonadota bacterium]|nr:hypothetical protein [Pseudomonadota bacterium]